MIWKHKEMQDTQVEVQPFHMFCRSTYVYALRLINVLELTFAARSTHVWWAFYSRLKRVLITFDTRSTHVWCAFYSRLVRFLLTFGTLSTHVWCAFYSRLLHVLLTFAGCYTHVWYTCCWLAHQRNSPVNTRRCWRSRGIRCHQWRQSSRRPCRRHRTEHLQVGKAVLVIWHFARRDRGRSGGGGGVVRVWNEWCFRSRFCT